MSLKICSISSGSTGNCIYLSSSTTKILVDIGVPVVRVARALTALKADPSAVNIVVTHEHSDHINNVPTFSSRYSSKTYCHYRTSPVLAQKHNMPPSRLTAFGDEDFFIGDITVSPFRVSHDVPTMGYSFISGGSKITVATDLGMIDMATLKKIGDSDVVLLECNHDETILRANSKYPQWLKKRILSDNGHLSNSACAAAALNLASSGVKQIILGHLSKENNYPELAYNTVREKLDSCNYTESEVKLEVASPDRLSGLYEVI